MITFTCACGRKLQAGDDLAGREGRCPACARVAPVPAARADTCLPWPGGPDERALAAGAAVARALDARRPAAAPGRSGAPTNKFFPESRGKRARLVGEVAVLLVLLMLWRPWEARYDGRPATWWDRTIRQEEFVVGGVPLPPAGSPLDRLSFGDPSAVPVLTELLDSPAPVSRRFACACLGNTGPEARPAVPALLRRLQDEDRSVRAEARRALRRIGPGARIPMTAPTEGAGGEGGE